MWTRGACFVCTSGPRFFFCGGTQILYNTLAMFLFIPFLCQLRYIAHDTYENTAIAMVIMELNVAVCKA